MKLLGEFATKHRATPAQIALGWLLAQRPWIVPIPGTTRLDRLEENIGAVSLELSAEDVDEITAAASRVPVLGNRYTDEMEKMSGL